MIIDKERRRANWRKYYERNKEKLLLKRREKYRKNIEFRKKVMLNNKRYLTKNKVLKK